MPETTVIVVEADSSQMPPCHASRVTHRDAGAKATWPSPIEGSPLTRELVERLRAALQRYRRKPWHADLTSAVPTQNRTAECTPLPFECPVHQPARRGFRAGMDGRAQSKDCTKHARAGRPTRKANSSHSHVFRLPACVCGAYCSSSRARVTT